MADAATAYSTPMPTKAIKERYQDKYLKWVIIIFIALGTLGVIGRLIILKHLSLSEDDSVWTVAIHSQLSDAHKDGRIIISPPWNYRQARMVSQKLQHTGMRVIRKKKSDIQNRNIVLQVINSGDLSLSAVFDIHLKRTQQLGVAITPQPPLDEEKRALYLISEDEIDLDSASLNSLLAHLSENATDNDQVISNIYSYTNKNIVKDIKRQNNSIDDVLRSNKATALGRARTMVGLCRAAGIPARIMTGLILEESAKALPHHWVEVYNHDKWMPYDPENGYAELLSSKHLAFNRGGSNIISTQNIDKVSITYKVQRNYDLLGLNIVSEKKLIDILNFERFSPNERESLGLLLLLPLGVLITAFCRHIIGIRGYGTFTSTLLALSLVYEGTITVLVLLSIVIALGLSGRSAMPEKLSRIIRLAIVFTIVAMSMVLGVSIMEFFHISTNENVVLLPMVILTALIDRFYSTVEDVGIYIAGRRLIWTIVMGVIIYPVLLLESLGALLLAFPESHFFTLTILLVLSKYKGKQLSEFAIFSWIKEPKSSKDKKPNSDNLG